MLFSNFGFGLCLLMPVIKALVSAMPTNPRISSSNYTSAVQFSCIVIASSPHLLLLDRALVHRSPFSETSDIFFASVDGTLSGVLDVLPFSIANYPHSDAASWSTVLADENFLFAPVDITSTSDVEQELLLLVSNSGSLFILNRLGTIISHYRIPTITVHRSDNLTTLPVTDTGTLRSWVRWSGDRTAKSIEPHPRLSPTVYTRPLVLPSSCAAFHGSESTPGCVIIAVNFLSADLILAALLALDTRTLLATAPSPDSLHWWQSAVLVPLELDRLDQVTPPYLFADLVPITSVPTPSDLSVSLAAWQPTFVVLVTLYGGSVALVRWPLEINAVSRFRVGPHESRGSQTGFSHSCLMVDCPRVHMKSGLPMLCCLLLDDSSNLRLIALNLVGSPDRLAHTERAILWTYRPFTEQSTTSHPRRQQQLGHVVLAPGSCVLSRCDLWAVYPTPDGFVQAVSVSSGKSIPGYPVRVFHPDRTDRFFTAGPGILYTPDGHNAWMLFFDTLGRFYHARLNEDPVILIGEHPPGSLESRGLVTWLSPVPIELTAPRAQTSALGLLVANTSGIGLLVPNNSSDHKLFDYPLFGATFLDDELRPTDVIHMGTDHLAIRYRIINCPILPDSGPIPQTSYVARLVDAGGRPLSAWSFPLIEQPTTTTTTLSSTALADHAASCHGLLTFTQPVHNSFRQMAHLLVLDTRTGRLPPVLGANSHRPTLIWSASVLLDAHSAWPPLLLLWSYLLPLFYFICSVIYLQWCQQQPQSHSRGDRFTAGRCVV